MSIMTSAVADQSSAIGSGSATNVPVYFEFAMMPALPDARELSW
jgi:hypothetical protein